MIAAGHYANLDNAITLFRDDLGRKVTLIAFRGDPDDAVEVRETPAEILKLAKG